MKLLKVIARINPRRRAPSVCEACGAEFTCGARLSGCWCAEIKLSEDVRARLRESYAGCLCRSCLERFAAEEGKEVFKDSQTENQLGTSH